ncbi:MAG: hypothetical protein KDC66_09175 [Phaeodactylibacter sp.]|nr:hypothetical protein [Phaeodactylibacter sp.]MCB9274786.1 ATPase [Lewinellaceae bacterium]
MPHPTLIIDSGGSKAAWALCFSRQETEQGAVPGIHPLLLDDEGLLTAVEMLSHELPHAPGAVYYYGTACTEAEPAGRIKQAFLRLYPRAHVEVHSDMLGAARGLWGQDRGLALILGTGSNVCLVENGEIVRNTGGLGYVLGDEGSGADLGRHLLAALLNGQLPAELKEKLEQAYSISRGAILEQVYRRPFANRYLASFAPFLNQNRQHPFVQQLALERFHALFRNCVIPMGVKTPVGCVGSVGFFFRELLALAASRHGFELARVMQMPMDGLIPFHISV